MLLAQQFGRCPVTRLITQFASDLAKGLSLPQCLWRWLQRPPSLSSEPFKGLFQLLSH